MVRVVKLLHCINACMPIVVTPLPIVTFVKFIHPRNAQASIRVTQSGIRRVVKELLPKTNLDISWIKEEGESADDYTLAELFSIIEGKSKTIASAVESLKKLIGDIEE